MAALAETHRPAIERRVAVLVVHDSEVLRLGLRVYLGSQDWVERCVGCSSVEEAVMLTRRFEPRVALVGSVAGGVPGAEICRRLLQESPAPRVVLCDAPTDGYAATARAAGAVALVTVDRPADRVGNALLDAALGRAVIDAPSAHPEEAGGFTRRQIAVLRGIARGQTNREIARELYLSPHTIKDCSRDVYRKLNARNRAQAVVRAQAIGLL